MKKYKIFSKVRFNELLILLIIGSFIGYILEGIWIYILFGVIESHSSLVIGPFCVVYGIGFAAAYAISSKVEEKNIFQIFFTYAFVGAITEYICSYLQELFLGSRSWNYVDHFLNINGRTSLKMFIIWGLLGVVFIKFMYPYIKKMFRKLNQLALGKICLLVTIFMIFDCTLTILAINRWNGRIHNIEATSYIERQLDKYYNDEKMKEIFCNMKFN